MVTLGCVPRPILDRYGPFFNVRTALDVPFPAQQADLASAACVVRYLNWERDPTRGEGRRPRPEPTDHITTVTSNRWGLCALVCAVVVDWLFDKELDVVSPFARND